MKEPKPIEFRGRALNDLRAFPISARREVGFQLDQVQHGNDPEHWKPMNAIGPGVREIRIRDEFGAFRVLYKVHGHGLRTALLSKEDSENQQNRY